MHTASTVIHTLLLAGAVTGGSFGGAANHFTLLPVIGAAISTQSETVRESAMSSEAAIPAHASETQRVRETHLHRWLAMPDTGNPDCYSCQSQKNQDEGPGWTCTQGSEDCHRHYEGFTTHKWWLNDHPLNVWLNGQCHNLCEGGPDAFQALMVAAVEMDKSIRTTSTSVYQIVHEDVGGEIAVSYLDGSIVLTSPVDCVGILEVPVPHSRWAEVEAEFSTGNG